MQMGLTQNANRRGVTLAELVIALGVLAVALTGIIAAIVNAMTAQSLNRQLNLARDAALGKIDEVRCRDYPLLTMAPPNGYGPVPPTVRLQDYTGVVVLAGAPPGTPPSAANGYEGSIVWHSIDLHQREIANNLPCATRGLDSANGYLWLDPTVTNGIMTVRVAVTWTSERERERPRMSGENLEAPRPAARRYETSQILSR